MKTPAPKHRAIIHLAADMRKGAGAHSVARKPGPSVEEWDDEGDEGEPLPCQGNNFYERFDFKTSK